MLLSHLRPRHSGLVRLLGPPWPAKEVLGAAQDQSVSAEGAIILHFLPKSVPSYLPSTWLMTLSGSTHTHTVMSEAASDTMKKLGVICGFPLPSWNGDKNIGS